MKRIISLLLALTCCVFALISCGEEVKPIDAFIDYVTISAPTRIITQTSYNDSVNENTLRGRFETTIYGEDFVMAYSYQDYAKVEPDANPDEYIKTHEGEIFYRDGVYSSDGGETWVAAVPDEVTMQVKLDLSTDNLGEYEISSDGKTVTAHVDAALAEKLLGVKLSATEEGIDVTIVTDGRNLRSILVTYATANATVVSIETSFSYNAVVSPFEEPETPETEE